MSKTFKGQFLVDQENVGRRLDAAIASKLGEFSRSRLKKEIENGAIRLNQKLVKPSVVLKNKDIITYDIENESVEALSPYAFPLQIYFQDEDVLVLEKPPNLITHPVMGLNTPSLVNVLIHHGIPLSPLGGTYRPGIVHRLYKDTTGVMVVAK